MTTENNAPRKAGLMARAMRGSAWIVLGYCAGQGFRLVSNLVLTRLLFPEAFGLMALIMVFIVGLTMFSDVGIGPSISQSKRGDEPDFLNTAWTIQAIRGGALWIVAAVLAWPVSVFYQEPSLVYLLPLAAVALIISGFDPTRIETAHRHLLMGRVTTLELISQIIGIIAMVALAILLNSVLALILGNLIGVAARLILMNGYLPGVYNQFRWEKSAASELLHFGKWIFASTVCGFFSSQGDRAVLGKFLTLAVLGVYNIGYFLASFPLLLGYAITGRVLIPVYRDTPPGASAANYRKLRRMRFVLTGVILSLVFVMAHIGPPLVALLYDDRYLAAGAIVVAIALVQITQVIGMSYDQAALAAGDSRGFFFLALIRAVLQLAGLLIGASTFGLLGALIGLGVATVAIHPAIIMLARAHHAWDPLHDVFYALIGALVGGWAAWRYWEILSQIG